MVPPPFPPFPPPLTLSIIFFPSFSRLLSGFFRPSFSLHHHCIFFIFLTFAILNHLILLPLPFFPSSRLPFFLLSIGAFFLPFVPSSSLPLLPLSSCRVCHQVFSLLTSFLSSSRPLSGPYLFGFSGLRSLSPTSLPSPLLYLSFTLTFICLGIAHSAAPLLLIFSYDFLSHSYL